MIRKLTRSRGALASLTAAALVFSTPVAAQSDSEDDGAAAMAALSEMFKVEPLTADQETRLPLAQSIIERMIPAGSLGELMGSMFDEIFTPIMSMATQTTVADVAGPLGFEAYELELDQEQLEQAARIVDPVRDERVAVVSSVMPSIMQEMMTAMEPAMRKAMSEAYAVHFTDQELADIDVFFSTESGLNFARKSLTMSSDPRIIGASLEAMPAMMGSLQNMEARIEEAAADLPPVRGYADLTEAERAELSEIIGISTEDMEQRAADKAEMDDTE